MRLRRLELQGFKTFATKTVLEFVPDAEGRRGITCIVGPNGSGKSNVADAIRWVMGEQSLKLIRGKKSEDVIFSGSEKRARVGFAEVSLHLENDDKPDIPMSDIVVTRRVYRDGQSDYEINKQTARMSDVHLLLAQAGIGQRTYSVIGQGMVDAVLSASPAERKDFFDEAAGLRPFHLKRHAAMNKLSATEDNLRQADLLLHEIEPRLQSLERLAKRLEQRETIEKELHDLEKHYFGQAFLEVTQRLSLAEKMKAQAEQDYQRKQAVVLDIEKELTSLEQNVTVSAAVKQLRQTLEALREDRARLRERTIRLEAKREIDHVRAEKPWSPLPLSKIIEEIDSFVTTHDELKELVHAKKPDLEKIRSMVDTLRNRHADLLSKLQRPAPEPVKTQTNPELERELSEITNETASVQLQIEKTEQDLATEMATEEGSRKQVFEIQHRLNRERHEAHEAERSLNQSAVELVRLESRHEALLNEINQHATHLSDSLDTLAQFAEQQPSSMPVEQVQARLSRLRAQLDQIGGIDPETLNEYHLTKARHDELSTQTSDLHHALQALQTIIDELDQTIKQRSSAAFQDLNREFQNYFQKLFGGGQAELVELDLESETDDEAEPTVGIDILATPPGKRLKAVSLLSGGEKALTSMALICAIMATNPSPFVVLDEVDAALDEANSRKIADILAELSDRTQFIVVTHNRATMHKANVLYGVTMTTDGVSQLLSVNLDQVSAAR